MNRPRATGAHRVDPWLRRQWERKLAARAWSGAAERRGNGENKKARGTSTRGRSAKATGPTCGACAARRTRGVPRSSPAAPARGRSGARCTGARSEERRGGTDKRKSQQAARSPRTADSARERAPRGLHARRASRVTRGACLACRHVYARWRTAEEGARSARGAGSEQRNDDEEAKRHHDTRRESPCSSAAARTASLRNARVARRRARVASRDAHGRGPLCVNAAKKERRDNVRPEDSKTYRTPPRSSQLRPSPHPPCASAEAATCR